MVVNEKYCDREGKKYEKGHKLAFIKLDSDLVAFRKVIEKRIALAQSHVFNFMDRTSSDTRKISQHAILWLCEAHQCSSGPSDIYRCQCYFTGRNEIPIGTS